MFLPPSVHWVDSVFQLLTWFGLMGNAITNTTNTCISFVHNTYTHIHKTVIEMDKHDSSYMNTVKQEHRGSRVTSRMWKMGGGTFIVRRGWLGDTPPSRTKLIAPPAVKYIIVSHDPKESWLGLLLLCIRMFLLSRISVIATMFSFYR